MHSAQETNRLISLVRNNPSATGTVLANLVPAVGVLFFGWDAFTVVFLYWLENAVIGVFNILKMALARSEIETVGDLLKAGPFGLGSSFKKVPEQVMKEWTSQPAPKIPGGLKFFLIPFFIVHYSGFMGVHLVFILVLLGPGQSLIGQTGVSPSSLFDFGFDTWELASLAIALISLVIEHGYSFYKDFWLSGEYRRAMALRYGALKRGDPL